MASLATQRATKGTLRQVWATSMRLLLTAVVIVGSLVLANVATHWLLGGLAVPRHAAAIIASVPATPTPIPMPNLPDANSVAVGIGATQSFRSLVLSVSNLRIATTHAFIGAPTGEAFAIVTVMLLNTDPAQSVDYNVADFALLDATGSQHPAAFAALELPLGAGHLAPHARVQGDLAFLVPYPADATLPGPLIRYLPSANHDYMVDWGVPLVPILP